MEKWLKGFVQIYDSIHSCLKSGLLQIYCLPAIGKVIVNQYFIVCLFVFDKYISEENHKTEKKDSFFLCLWVDNYL